jgi:hypothetical protein
VRRFETGELSFEPRQVPKGELRLAAWMTVPAHDGADLRGARIRVSMRFVSYSDPLRLIDRLRPLHKGPAGTRACARLPAGVVWVSPRS